MIKPVSAWFLKSKIMSYKFDMFFKEITKWVDDGSPVDVIFYGFPESI